MANNPEQSCETQKNKKVRTQRPDFQLDFIGIGTLFSLGLKSEAAGRPEKLSLFLLKSKD
jgi:hypothetical protein